MISDDGPYTLAQRVGTCLDQLIVPWAVGGSLASSLYGIPRSTYDVDLVVALGFDDVAPLIEQLAPLGYVDADAARDAVRRSRSFNLIDDATLQKVDFFCVHGEAARQIERARRVEIAPGLLLPITSPEDIITQKLRWFHSGGRTSDRQWRDVMEVIRVQGSRLDLSTLRELAVGLHVADLLDVALTGATNRD